MVDVYLTTKDIEKKYNVGSATVRKWRNEGMPFYRIGSGRTLRYIESEVEAWVKKQSKKDK